MGRLLKKKDGTKQKRKKVVAGPDSVKDRSGDTAKAALPAQVGARSGVKRLSKKKEASPGSKGEKNILDKSIQFLREVKVELKKVTWPSRKQTMGSTVVVIAVVIVISLFLGFVDIGLSSIVKMVLQ